MINIIFRRLLMVMATASLIACGSGGGGGGGIGGAVGGIAGGGVSGTGLGTVTGFGSIIINDTREFEFDGETRFFRDGVEITEAVFMQNGTGMVSRVEIGEDVSADFTSGTAVTVTADNAVKGPVTSVNPLQVLEQTVVVTGNTVLDNMPGNDTGNLVLGDIVEVSGFADSANVIQATRVEFKAAGAPVWKLTGTVSNVIANTSFRVGTQLVVLNGVVPRDCGTSLNNGEFVEVKAAEDPGFTPGGDTLDSVTDVECKVPGLGVPDNATGAVLDAEIEGIVTTVTAPDDFIVNGQRVVTNGTTEFEGGAAEDIVVGVKLEAEGDFNTNTGILTADKIRFRETRTRIEAPVTVPGGGLGGTFIIMDVITVITTSLTEDDDGLVDGSGPSGSMQVEVRGFVDGNGTVIATRVRERGSSDFTDVRLRGPIDNIVNPTFEILGVTVDTATAVSIFDDTVSPAQLINATTFFNRVSDGTPVQVEDATFSSGPPFITSGDIEIED